jgi:hypothetical protein
LIGARLSSRFVIGAFLLGVIDWMNIPSNYKVPIAFYVAGTNVSGADMLRLLKININALFDAGAIVRAFTCDQGLTTKH